MIPGGPRRPAFPPYRRCPGCGCNVAQLSHEPDTEECRAALDARVHTYTGDNT